MHPNMTETLLSARKAYRFLFEYQTKIKDLVYFIGTKFGLDYFGGYAKFSDPSPKNSKGYLDNWAWDWLNMYCYEFHFYSKLENNDEIRLSIFHIADTGYFDSTEEPKYHDDKKLQINTFKSIEGSQSKLIFVASINMWLKDCQECKGIDGKWSFKALNEKPFSIEQSDKGGTLLHKQYDLAKFYDESSTLSCMRDFENLCKQNSIPLKIQDIFIKRN